MTLSEDEATTSKSADKRKKIFLGISIAASLALIHFAIRKFIPSFSVLYDGPERPSWITWMIDCEFVLHLLFFGALVTVTGRSIPALNNPRYSDDGTESLFSSGSSEASTDWASIGLAWGCLPVYVLLWMAAYGYLG